MSNPGLGLITGPKFLAVMRKFAENLEVRAQEINDLNVFPVPDSDTGSNSSITVAAGLAPAAELEQAAQAGLGEVVALIASGCSQNALGNSGIIFSEYLRGLGTVLDDDADVTQWAHALREAAVAAREALLAPEDGTILTVAAAIAQVPPDSNFKNFLLTVQGTAREALVQTQFMLPALSAAGVVDAGAVVVTLLHDAFASELAGSNESALLIATRACESFPEDYDGPRFEVMVEFQGSNSQKEELQNAVTNFGDSISISGSEPQFNFHIHADDPERVIDLIRSVVSIGEVRIQDLQAT